jgi:hypothetical protein
MEKEIRNISVRKAILTPVVSNHEIGAEHIEFVPPNQNDLPTNLSTIIPLMRG